MEDAAGAVEALVMLTHPEDEKLFLFLVPVGADALEATGAVVEGMGHDADLSLLNGHELTFEKRILSHFIISFGILTPRPPRRWRLEL